MSGYAADEAVRRGVAAGAHNFLQKPFTPAVLATRVRALLDETVGPGPEAEIAAPLPSRTAVGAPVAGATRAT